MSVQFLLLVGAGSFIGGVLRYLLSTPFLHKYPHGFPWGTLLVNILGCLLIGILYGYAARWPFPKEWRMFLAVGVLGGFTTFSSFSNESLTLMQNGQFGYAISYILSSVCLGLGATYGGLLLTKAI